MIRRQFFRSLIGFPVAGAATATEPKAKGYRLKVECDMPDHVQKEMARQMELIIPKLRRALQENRHGLADTLRRS